MSARPGGDTPITRLPADGVETAAEVAVVAARRLWIALAGTVVVVLGIVLLPLPGPGSLVILAGLSILSLEYDRPARVRRWLITRATRTLRTCVERCQGPGRL